jgi:hypothetical protein
MLRETCGAMAMQAPVERRRMVMVTSIVNPSRRCVMSPTSEHPSGSHPSTFAVICGGNDSMMMMSTFSSQQVIYEYYHVWDEVGFMNSDVDCVVVPLIRR